MEGRQVKNAKQASKHAMSIYSRYQPLNDARDDCDGGTGFRFHYFKYVVGLPIYGKLQ